MTSGYTIFITYQFEDTPASASTSYGYSTPLHCNYIQKLETNSLSGKALSLFFSSEDDLPFLADTNSNNGTGFTATKINALVQVVNGTGSTISPISSDWYKINITNQIEGQIIGAVIDKALLTNTIFRVEFADLVDKYNLDYLNYPSNNSSIDEMGIGEESFVFGTISTDIRATVYTTDIPIILPLNSYNTTTNPTWDGSSTVSISEVGIYDDDDNLVAIGKLNHPIDKNSTIARTIAFQLDF